MLWNKTKNLLLALLLSGLAVPVFAVEVCPVRSEYPLRFVDVFDGPAEGLATLIPDKVRQKSGYWILGYIYDAGRFVTFHCKYADGQQLEKMVTQKLSRCDYKIDAHKNLQLDCRS